MISSCLKWTRIEIVYVVPKEMYVKQLTLSPILGGSGLLEPVPAFEGREAGTPWIGRQPIAGL